MPKGTLMQIIEVKIQKNILVQPNGHCPISLILPPPWRTHAVKHFFWTLFLHLFLTLPKWAKSAQTILASVLTPLKQEIAYLDVQKKCSKPSGAQTWNLSKNLQDRRFQGKKFTQKTRNFRHLLNRDKKCVNALNWDKTSKKSLFYQFILSQHQ